MRPLLSVVLCFCTAALGQYVLEDDYTGGSGFADRFNFFTDDDPTHGYVNYVDYNTAVTDGLYRTFDDDRTIYLGVDYTNNAIGRGRNSLRLESKAVYNHGLFIIDLQHMPGGQCAVWPALWFLGPDWPSHGEFDIIENINTATFNQMSLKTNQTCFLEAQEMDGELLTRDCNVNTGGVSGCAIDSGTVSSAYGQGFNERGGGVYATEWTSDAVSVWYFAESNVPTDIGYETPDPSSWGPPLAKFVTSCTLDEHFVDQQLIINIAFCGDWAGGLQWATTPECTARAAQCSDYVQGNPSDFEETYWLINSLKVYTSTSVTTTTTSTTTTAISTSSSTLSTTAVTTTTTTPVTTSTSTTSTTVSSTVNPISTSASTSTSSTTTSTISSAINPISTSASTSTSSATSSLTSSVLSSSTIVSSTLSSTPASYTTSRSTADPISTNLTTISETTTGSSSSSSPTSSESFRSMSTASLPSSHSPSSTGPSGSSIGPISTNTHTTIRSWLDMSQSFTSSKSLNSVLPSPTTGSIVWVDWSEDDSSASTTTITRNSGRPTSGVVYKTTLTTTWIEPCATGLITKTVILTTTHCSCTEQPPASIRMTTETVKLPANWPVPNPFVVTMPVTTTLFAAKASETGRVNGWAVGGDGSASTVTVDGYQGGRPASIVTMKGYQGDESTLSVAKASKTGHANGWAVDGDGPASTVTMNGHQGGSLVSTVTIKGFQGDESTTTVTATRSDVTVVTTVTLEPVAPTEAASQTIPTSSDSANAWSPADTNSNSDTGDTSPSTSGPWIATYTGAAGAAAVSATMVVFAVSLCLVLMQFSGL